MIERIKHETYRVILKHYQGSLDFDCDFCGTNAYDNFHISKNGELQFVVCAKCLDKAHELGGSRG